MTLDNIGTPCCTLCSWRGDRCVFTVTAWGQLDHHLFEVHGWTAADVVAASKDATYRRAQRDLYGG